jgi:hypothetical protein
MISEKLLDDEPNKAPPSPPLPASPLLRRASTFDIWSKNVEQGVNKFGTGIDRTFSQLVDWVDPDHAVTSALIADYKKRNDEGVVGNFPFPPGKQTALNNDGEKI